MSQRESTSSAQHGVIDAQQIQTQIQGKLHEWTDISSIFNPGQWRESGIVYEDEDKKKRHRQVSLKIVEIQ